MPLLVNVPEIEPDMNVTGRNSMGMFDNVWDRYHFTVYWAYKSYFWG